MWIGLGVVVLIVVVIVLFAGGSYVSTKNTLVQKNESVDQAYAQVDVVQQRRLDLIPNLVASVKGFAKQELTVFDDIAKARSGLLQAQTPDEKMAANGRLDVALLPLMRMQETYPELKSNDQFMRLEDELSGTENRIGVARKRYNDSVTAYNTYIGQFPNSIWAGLGSPAYTAKTYFKASPTAATAPTVSF